MLAVGRPRRVERALLGEQHVGTLRMAAMPDLGLGADDLLERCPEVHRGRAAAALGAPGNRPVEGPVELADSRPVAVASQPAPVAGREPVVGDPKDLARGEIEQDRCARRELGNRRDRVRGGDLATQLAQM